MRIRQERAGGMVETKGISQPFTLKGGAEQGFGRVDSQSAYVHACKVWGSDSWCSNLGITSTENRCQRLRTFALRPFHTLDRCLWRRCRQGGPDRRLRWKALRILCLFHTRRSQQDRPRRWRRHWFGSLETTAQRVGPDVVHETCGGPSAGSEPTALSAS